MEPLLTDDQGWLCVPTPDGDAHVIPADVIARIAAGEMDVTEMDGWRAITRAIFGEWLRGVRGSA